MHNDCVKKLGYQPIVISVNLIFVIFLWEICHHVFSIVNLTLKIELY